MQAEVVIYASEKLLKPIQEDRSLEQLIAASCLPKVISPVLGMPDIHEGFGLPIGGVMATQGLVSAGAVGMDINCGVRLLLSQQVYDKEVFTPSLLRQLIEKISQFVPLGLGGQQKGHLGLSLEKVCRKGLFYMVEKGLAQREDLERTEENGRMEEAEFSCLSTKAISRAKNELGTLGSGNHFIEIQKVDRIFNKQIAQAFGLFPNQIAVMIHTGSRALGHQTCLDYTQILWRKKEKYQLTIPNQGLAALPVTTPEGERYFGAMAACVNFAFVNRQIITHFVRQAWRETFGNNDPLYLLYDVAHNIAKWENHLGQKVLVHRKGATRALPPNHPQNPPSFVKTGHPALIPGSMGTASYVVVGTSKNKDTFHSVNHGAGRLMSRRAAQRNISLPQFEKSMGKIIYNLPFHKIADEAPGAYKDIEEVVDVLVKEGLTSKVARLKPLAVIKGT
ncbi:RtcB family protein [Candidatus Shapirobacteria bacterium]|nr:RtcB family protein [Candidatus Shapirobacteria bacterium]